MGSRDVVTTPSVVMTLTGAEGMPAPAALMAETRKARPAHAEGQVTVMGEAVPEPPARFRFFGFEFTT